MEGCALSFVRGTSGSSVRLQHGLAAVVGTGTAALPEHRPRASWKSQARARQEPLHGAAASPPALAWHKGCLPAPSTALLLKIISGSASASGALSFLASSRGLNILFLFAFLTVRCLPGASHKPSDASKSGFPSLCAWAGALAQPLPTLFPQGDLEGSTSFLFHGTEEAERLKVWLSDPPHSKSIDFYLACSPLLLPTHLAIKYKAAGQHTSAWGSPTLTDCWIHLEHQTHPVSDHQPLFSTTISTDSNPKTLPHPPFLFLAPTEEQSPLKCIPNIQYRRD